MVDRPNPVDVVRSVYRAMDADDRTALRALLADDLRWRQAGSEVPAAAAERVGVESFLGDVLDGIDGEWSGFREPVEQMVDAGRSVIAIGTYGATHRRTGGKLHAEFCHIWRVELGRVVGFRQFTDTAAFAAARRG